MRNKWNVFEETMSRVWGLHEKSIWCSTIEVYKWNNPNTYSSQGNYKVNICKVWGINHSIFISISFSSHLDYNYTVLYISV